MTLAQFDALASVEERANKRSDQKLPHPSQRNWGSANDLRRLEGSNGIG